MNNSSFAAVTTNKSIRILYHNIAVYLDMQTSSGGLRSEYANICLASCAPARDCTLANNTITLVKLNMRLFFASTYFDNRMCAAPRKKFSLQCRNNRAIMSFSPDDVY